MVLTAEQEIEWNLLTSVNVLNLSLCFILGVAQYLCNKYRDSQIASLRPTKRNNNSLQRNQTIRTRTSNSIQDKMKQFFDESNQKQSYLMYAIYTVCGMCASLCFLCHYSKDFPKTFCVWGTPVCVVLYATSKSLLFGFFLERAKLGHGLVHTFPEWLLDRLLPAYIAIYWISFTILILMFFRGKPLYDDITSCVFDVFLTWLFQIGGSIDVLNCILFLGLLLYPVKKAYHSSIESLPLRQRKAFVEAMGYNIVMSAVCTATTFSVMFLMPVISPQHVWLAGGSDMMINCVCVFFTLTSNKAYLKHKLCFCGKSESKVDLTTSQQVTELQVVNFTVPEHNSADNHHTDNDFFFLCTFML